jgi:cation diffusion facilitator family transporter
MASATRTAPADRTRLIATASWIALVGNAFLAALKIAVGLAAGSLAVVGDGLDSSADVAIAVMSLMVARISAQPADRDHPWGHGRAETVATTVLAFILFFAGGQLGLRSIHALIDGAAPEPPGLVALAVTGVSIVGKLLLAWSQSSLGKRAGSSMLIANGKNMRGDVMISSGVLVGLAVAILFKFPPADAIVALLVSAWVIKTAAGVFKEANLELMDGSQDTGPYAELFEAVHSVPGAGNPHRARMRRIAGTWDIDLDIEVDGQMSVAAAHAIANSVEAAIKSRVDGVYDIVVHVEPAGSAEAHGAEGFGLHEKSLGD